MFLFISTKNSDYFPRTAAIQNHFFAHIPTKFLFGACRIKTARLVSVSADTFLLHEVIHFNPGTASEFQTYSFSSSEQTRTVQKRVRHVKNIAFWNIVYAEAGMRLATRGSTTEELIISARDGDISVYINVTNKSSEC